MRLRQKKNKNILDEFFLLFSLFAVSFLRRSSYSPRKAGSSVSRRQVEPSSIRQLHTTHPPSLPSLTSTILPHSVSPVPPRRASPSSLLTFGLPSTSAAGAGSAATKPAALDLSSDTSGQFLAETRATFARLEKEAEELEKTYQSFHQKAEGFESPGVHEDEPLLPFHQTTLGDHESSSISTTTTPDRGVSPTLPTSTMLLQPQGVATLSLPTPISSSLSTITSTATSTTHNTITSSSSMQPNLIKSLVSTSHPASTLTTVVATAPPTLTATTTPPLDVAAAAVSPPPPFFTKAKPVQIVSTEETSVATNVSQRLTLDDWWKKSPPPPPPFSLVSSKQPSNTVVASSPPPVESSKPTAVGGGHNKSSHITEKPKIKLDDLWKSSNTVSGTHTVGDESKKAINSSIQDGQRSHSPPPVKVETPKLSLDDLWKNPSPSKPTATATSAKPAVALSKQLKEEREEKEKLRREQQLQEQERVRKELEELEKQEKLKKVEPSSQQGKIELPENKNGDTQQRMIGQEASVEVTSKETEGGDDKKKSVGSDNDGIDPVMLKYMELVKEKREKQQVYNFSWGFSICCLFTCWCAEVRAS